MRDGGFGTRLDGAFLAGLAGRADPAGYLTVTVGVDPREQATRRAPWAIEVDNELHALEAQTREEGPRERWLALRDCLERVAPELERLLDASQPGRGRALFAPVSEGGREAETVVLQQSLPTRVVLEDRPYVLPLVAALERGRPAGIVTVSRDGLRAVELAFGVAAEVAAIDIAAETEDWRELKGPTAGNPARARQTFPQRDRFEHRLADVVERAVEAHALELGELARDRTWEHVLVAGDPRLTAPLAAALAAAGHEAEAVPRVVAGDAAAVADALRGELASAREARLRALAARVREEAGEAGLGLRATLAALNEGRAAVLVLDEEAGHAGYVAEDGRLLAEGPAAGLRAEPRLAERMVERALATGARVVPVAGAAELLGTPDGVGALLRW